MDLFGMGKKKEGTSQNMPPPMGMPESQDQYAQGYGQEYAEYPQEAYPQQYPPGNMEQPPQQPYPQQQPYPEINKEQIEEIAEAIVEEKWKEKNKKIDKIIEWKEETTTTLIQLKQQIDDLKASFDSLHKGMLGKISEYDENLTNVGTEIKAMEKVFSKVLPSMTDSVNKLQRMSSLKKK